MELHATMQLLHLRTMRVLYEGIYIFANEIHHVTKTITVCTSEIAFTSQENPAVWVVP